MQTKQNEIGLVWFTNNLRVKDNYVLQQALQNHKSIIGCYCFNPKHFEHSDFGFKKTEKYRAQFLIDTVSNLKSNLKPLNIELFVFNETPETAIKYLVEKHHIASVYHQKEWTSEEVQEINNVKLAVPKTVIWHSLYNQFLYHPEDINMSYPEIPKVFTNFRKKVEKHGFVRPLVKCDQATKTLPIENHTTIPTLNDLGFQDFKPHPNTAFPFKGGETSALKRLNDYFFTTKKLSVYKKTRNGLIGSDFSSKFSPWLANGSLSPRTIYWNVKHFEKEHLKNQSTYWLVFELIWRDYFKYISLKHHNDIFKIGGILHKNYLWESNEQWVKSWIHGETRSSFVNANMIEIKKTGWMSNRGRQNVASFFAKELMLDWRIGAAYFESMLIDYDVHSNYGNWMYVAGVGNDPRDRTFNVDLQAKRYDPQNKYQCLWLQQTLF